MDKFSQDPGAGFWVDKSNAPAMSTPSWSGVYQADALSGELLERLIEVVYLIADMVNAVAPLGMEASDGSFEVCRLNELDPAASKLEGYRLDGLLWKRKSSGGSDAKSAVLIDRGIQIRDDDADMMEAHRDLRGEGVRHMQPT